MTKLDEIAINVELVLISLIEGAALVTLSENAIAVMREPHPLQYVPYIVGGLAILLVFWAQSILHAVSFIRWPIRIEHMFLYFVSALLQMIAYYNIVSLTSWFFWWTIFSVVAIVMYWLDLSIIRESREAFANISGGATFLDEVERRHIYEMKYLVPAALAFNVIAGGFVYFFPQLFTSPLAFAIPGTLQLVVSLAALYDCTQNFRDRGLMIGRLFT